MNLVDGRVWRQKQKRTYLHGRILLMTIISFIVGLAISSQTFYTFIIENLEEFIPRS